MVLPIVDFLTAHLDVPDKVSDPFSSGRAAESPCHVTPGGDLQGQNGICGPCHVVTAQIVEINRRRLDGIAPFVFTGIGDLVIRRFQLALGFPRISFPGVTGVKPSRKREDGVPKSYEYTAASPCREKEAAAKKERKRYFFI